jgi:diaminohydroxyphosphoribosylaminopyrimidine deaminase/5-amino-6-(5-phosphoribosylamino)uracil reductase
MSLDGRTALASGESKWITGEAARADVQRWRARSSAILTGSGTVLADNPRLTVRFAEGQGGDAFTPFQPPLRVIVDRQLRTPAGSHVLDGSVPTLVLHAQSSKDDDDRFRHVDCVAVSGQDNRLDLAAVLHLLAERGCNEVHMEAGPTLCGALFDAGLADELLLYVAPVLLGDSARPLMHRLPLKSMEERRVLSRMDEVRIGDDWRYRFRIAR